MRGMIAATKVSASGRLWISSSHEFCVQRAIFGDEDAQHTRSITILPFCSVQDPQDPLTPRGESRLDIVLVVLYEQERTAVIPVIHHYSP